MFIYAVYCAPDVVADHHTIDLVFHRGNILAPQRWRRTFPRHTAQIIVYKHRNYRFGVRPLMIKLQEILPMRVITKECGSPNRGWIGSGRLPVLGRFALWERDEC